MINYLPAVIIFFLSCNTASQNSPAETAELVINNAKVYTVNKNQPDAEALAVKDGKIIFVGNNADAKKYAQEADFVNDAQKAMENKLREILKLHGKEVEIHYSESPRTRHPESIQVK